MKHDINPMQRAPRCTARSKRTGLSCGSPAVRGRTVCRMHGAGGGAPEGKANGNYRHGGRTKRTMAASAMVNALARESRKSLKQLEDLYEH